VAGGSDSSDDRGTLLPPLAPTPLDDDAATSVPRCCCCWDEADASPPLLLSMHKHARTTHAQGQSKTKQCALALPTPHQIRERYVLQVFPLTL
jgi:hypothetical protein